ncbi:MULTISPECIES: hypothetical protein [Streptomyces]|uniref:hypothetical protein n=1 Tax=Streptomyces TaxID=1883 RepID=UPI001D285497|nr:hypothetical protein [Streptomyces sp. MAG02]
MTAYLGSFELPWDGSSQLPELRAHLTRAGVPIEDAGLELRYQWNGVDCTDVTQNRPEQVFRRRYVSKS